MKASESIEAPARPVPTRWLVRLQFALVIGAAWWLLRGVLEPLLLPDGLKRPLVFAAAPTGVLAIALAVALAHLGAILTGRRFRGASLLIFGLVLAGWSGWRGTMDDWLILSHPVPGPGTAGPYAFLLIDYLLLAAAVAALLWLEGFFAAPTPPDTGPVARGVALDPPRLAEGAIALGVGVAVAAMLLYMTGGPAYAITRTGQVYFGIVLGCWLGVLAAQRASAARPAVWFLAIPLVVGALGMALCAARPELGGGYAQKNIIPAWSGLGRPLPAQMVGVGLVTVLYTLHSQGRRDSEPAASSMT